MIQIENLGKGKTGIFYMQSDEVEFQFIRVYHQKMFI